MSLIRLLRGLLGTALTWGVIGAVVGVPTYVVVMRPWPLSDMNWQRMLTTFGAWEGASFLWGLATGLTFGLVIAALERSRRLQQLEPSRVALWGAVAGAAFPSVLAIAPLMSGASAVYFGLIIAASAVTGAVWAHASLKIARRGAAAESPTPLRS